MCCLPILSPLMDLLFSYDRSLLDSVLVPPPVYAATTLYTGSHITYYSPQSISIHSTYLTSLRSNSKHPSICTWHPTPPPQVNLSPQWISSASRSTSAPINLLLSLSLCSLRTSATGDPGFSLSAFLLLLPPLLSSSLLFCLAPPSILALVYLLWTSSTPGTD